MNSKTKIQMAHGMSLETTGVSEVEMHFGPYPSKNSVTIVIGCDPLGNITFTVNNGSVKEGIDGYYISSEEIPSLSCDVCKTDYGVFNTVADEGERICLYCLKDKYIAELKRRKVEMGGQS